MNKISGTYLELLKKELENYQGQNKKSKSFSYRKYKKPGVARLSQSPIPYW